MSHLVQIVTHPLTAHALMRGQLAYLRHHGFRVTLVTSPRPVALREAVARREKIEIVTVPMPRTISPLADLAALVRLTRLLRRLAPDIVNAGTPKAGLLGMLAARAAGVPRRCYTLRGLRLETTRGPTRRLLGLAERITAACAQRIVCVSPSLETRYRELGFGTGKTTVLASGSSNGIDLDEFDQRSAREQTSTLRRRLGLEEAGPVVGFVGRLTRDKGIDDLVEAFGRLAASRPTARLLLLGEFERGDRLATGLRHRIAERSEIIHAGFVGETAPYYALMDVVALPTYREGFPNVVLEAAAARLPVVGYASTGVLDAIADGQTGRLVRRGDQAALAAALGAYLDDPETRRRHGDAGRQRVESLFQSRRLWEAWAAFFRDWPAPN